MPAASPSFAPSASISSSESSVRSTPSASLTAPSTMQSTAAWLIPYCSVKSAAVASAPARNSASSSSWEGSLPQPESAVAVDDREADQESSCGSSPGHAASLCRERAERLLWTSMGRTFKTKRAAIHLGALALGLVAALALTALLPAAAPAAKTTVFINGDSISNYKFTPPTVTIRRKQAVQWTWDSNAPHNVKFPKTGKTSVTGASETYKLKFKRRGTFKYLCTIHDFHGKVIVKK